MFADILNETSKVTMNENMLEIYDMNDEELLKLHKDMGPEEDRSVVEEEIHNRRLTLDSDSVGPKSKRYF